MEFDDGIKPLIESEKQLDVRADFVPEVEAAKTYLHRGFGNSYNFNQTP